LPDLKTHWRTFYEKAQFYGVFKNVMKAPQQDKGNYVLLKHSVAFIKALSDMFPSPVASTKKLGHASEAMFHILEIKAYEHYYIQTRPLFSPVVIVCKTNCLMSIGTMPKADIYASMMYLMACYYAFPLTYPKCIATL
ncbi:hypothetical protein C0J50_20112, partial [Silurus asotus]